tara:strand:+ start:8656 stop:9204 length:549 start_codon:yes stop_codon:yes gene_type:complete
MKLTIQEKIFMQLVGKKSFTRAELDKAIWIAQGYDPKLFTRRNGYYGINLSNWISSKLVKRIKRGVFKITFRGELYLTDRARCNNIIRRERDARRRRRDAEIKDHFEGVNDFKNLIGKTIKSIRRLSPIELDNLGWSKNPLVLELDNGTCLIPQTDDEGNDGGAVLHVNFRRGGVSKTIYTT